ncbi:nuclear transport factor 2 family protein [Mucilaginibacter lutimaris]|uniref:Nuclear transport factor 2 family protein n=1 Tax=Mucilaginibacter lutimaris TaxID=931629 RepID=A0ABW2ZL10_9SPHI
MNLSNKSVLLKANACVIEGDNEGFLLWCTDDVKWEFVGDKTLTGKEAVREYMNLTYVEPPKFDVENLIEADEYVTAIGKISMKDEEGQMNDYAYCDVWRFREGKMCELRAFVIKL